MDEALLAEGFLIVEEDNCQYCHEQYKNPLYKKNLFLKKKTVF